MLLRVCVVLFGLCVLVCCCVLCAVFKCVVCFVCVVCFLSLSWFLCVGVVLFSLLQCASVRVVVLVLFMMCWFGMRFVWVGAFALCVGFAWFVFVLLRGVVLRCVAVACAFAFALLYLLLRV